MLKKYQIKKIKKYLSVFALMIGQLVCATTDCIDNRGNECVGKHLNLCLLLLLLDGWINSALNHLRHSSRSELCLLDWNDCLFFHAGQDQHQAVPVKP